MFDIQTSVNFSTKDVHQKLEKYPEGVDNESPHDGWLINIPLLSLYSPVFQQNYHHVTSYEVFYIIG